MWGMWKAAHVELAKYLTKQEQLKDLSRHQLAFMMGSVLPDCLPSFLTKRHRMEETFFVVEKEIQRLQQHNKVDFYFCLHLGVVLHYLADYFTYPHNQTFHGNFVKHCLWEKEQWKDLTRYLKNSVMPVSAAPSGDLRQYLLKKHDEYLKREVSLANDGKYVIEVTYRFAVALLQVTEDHSFCEEIRGKGKLQ